MSNRKGFAIVAVSATLVCGGLVKADDIAVSANDLSLATPAYLDTAPQAPLMSLLDKAGVGQTLEKANIKAFGFVEASYTASFSAPPGNVITGRVFDIDHEDPTLNQLDLTLQRVVDASEAAKSGKADVGFTLETMYGGDARFIHSNGMNFYGSDSPQINPDEQIDVTQLYLDVALPVGNGLLIRAGKFATHMGYETINPTTNSLYSHSYLFGFAIPFTHTGVMAFYNLNDKVSIMGGISRGWNQSLKDNNGDAIDFLGQVVYKQSDATTIYFNTTIGPEAAGDQNWWGVGDFILSHKISDQLSVAVNADYGLYVHGDPTGNGGPAMWYGAAAYATYTINDMFAINGRTEWYDDNDGFTLGGGPNVVYETTLGVGIHPMPNDAIGKNLLIRPEIRFDYSDKAFYDGGTDHYQFTAGVDAIFQF